MVSKKSWCPRNTWGGARGRCRRTAKNVQKGGGQSQSEQGKQRGKFRWDFGRPAILIERNKQKDIERKESGGLKKRTREDPVLPSCGKARDLGVRRVMVTTMVQHRSVRHRKVVGCPRNSGKGHLWVWVMWASKGEPAFGSRTGGGQI